MKPRLHGSVCLPAMVSPRVLWAFLSVVTLLAGLWFELSVRHASDMAVVQNDLWFVQGSHWLSRWWLASFPSFTLALLVLSLWHWWRPASAGAAILPVGAVLLTMEGAQASGWLANARFDWLDMAAIGLAMVLVAGLKRRDANTPLVNRQAVQRIWKRAAMVGFACGLTAQLACYSLETGCDAEDSEVECDKLVRVSKEEVRAEIIPEYGNTATLEIPGKMYQQAQYLGVVDKYRGLHIFNMTDAQNPVREVYLPIHGITDLTVKDDFLYVNSYMDMVTINMDDVRQGTFSASSVIRELEVFTWASPYAFFAGSKMNSGDYMKRVDSTRIADDIYIGYETPDGKQYLYGQRDLDVLVEEIP